MDDIVEKLSAGKYVYFVTVVVRSVEAVGEGDNLAECVFFFCGNYAESLPY